MINADSMAQFRDSGFSNQKFLILSIVKVLGYFQSVKPPNPIPAEQRCRDPGTYKGARPLVIKTERS